MVVGWLVCDVFVILLILIVVFRMIYCFFLLICIVCGLMIFIVLVVMLMVIGCKKLVNVDEVKMLLILQFSFEDWFVLGESEYSLGLLIIGVVQLECCVDLCVEVLVVVQQVFKENGELVCKGDLLVCLDVIFICDSFMLVEEVVCVVNEVYQQFDCQWQCQKILQVQGMIFQQVLEDVQNCCIVLFSEKVVVEVCFVFVWQQVMCIEVCVFFDGVVSECQVLFGDMVQVGKVLLKVIDFGSMCFEGYVLVDCCVELKIGQLVDLCINGVVNLQVEGCICCIDVVVDLVMCQVVLLVDFFDFWQVVVVGFYGEGYV